MNRKDKAEKVLQIVESFVKDQQIHCPEVIYQSDRVIMNAYEFIDELVSIAGFLPDDKEDEE